MDWRYAPCLSSNYRSQGYSKGNAAGREGFEILASAACALWHSCQTGFIPDQIVFTRLLSVLPQLGHYGRFLPILFIWEDSRVTAVFVFHEILKISLVYTITV